MPFIDPTFNITTITNPFNPNEFVIDKMELAEYKDTVGNILDAREVDGEWVVSLNGGVVKAEDYHQTYVNVGDSLTLFPVPQGGEGGGKAVLRVVALIAIAIFAPYLAGLAVSAGLVGAGLGATVLTAGIMIAGSMLVNALLPLPKPEFATSGDAFETSPSYGIDGAKNTSSENIPVPVIYGRFRFGGNIIGLYVENENDTQQLYMLLNFGEGEIAGIEADSIMINDQPLTSYNDVFPTIRLGTDPQELIPWFSDTIVPYAVGRTLTTAWDYYTTTDVVDRLRLDFVAPQGLRSVDTTDGSTNAVSVALLVEYRLPGGVWADLTDTSFIESTFETYLYYGTTDPVPSLIPGDITVTTLTFAGGTISQVLRPGYIYRPNPNYDFDASREYFTVGTVVVNPVYKSGFEITAKSASPVRRSLVSSVLPQAVYEIRVARNTAESSSEYVQDTIVWSDTNQIVMDNVSYIHTALLAIKIKLSDQLSSLPKVTALCSGRVVAVYNPDTEAWFNDWSDNPAWIVWDILTHDRYGGGIDEARLDLDQFIDWASFCDLNGLKFNGPIDVQTNVWDSCQPVLRVGHAQIVNVGTRYSLIIEKPDTAKMMFGVNNIMKESFSNSWLPMGERANVVELSYFDENDEYKKNTVRVYDQGMLPTDPERISNVTMIGVTDPDQAAKEAQFQLNFNRYIQQTVQFDAALESIACTVGDLIYVQHDMPEWGHAGKLEAGNTTTVLNLDRSVSMSVGTSYIALVNFDAIQRAAGTVSAINGDALTLTGWTETSEVTRIQVAGLDLEIVATFATGVIVADATSVSVTDAYVIFDTDVIEERGVVVVDGDHTSITLESPLSAAPAQYSNFMFGANGKVKKPFRVTALGGDGDYIRTISAIEYNESIYDLSGAPTPTPNYSSLQTEVQQSTIDEITEELYLQGTSVGTRAVVHFQNSSSVYKTSYVYVSSNGGLFERMGSGKESVAFPVDENADIIVRVVAYSILGLHADYGSAPTLAHTVVGKAAPPGDVQNFLVTRVQGGLELTWDAVGDLDLLGYEVRTGASWAEDNVISTDIGGTRLFVPILTTGSYAFFIKAIDTSRNYSVGTATQSFDIARPAAPLNFSCVQQSDQVHFQWVEPGSIGFLKYEIRDGEDWANSVSVGITSGDTYIGPSSIDGPRTYWIKTVDDLGLYSVDALFATTDIVRPTIENVIFSEDHEALGYPGLKIDMDLVSTNLQMDVGVQYGEYITQLDIGYSVRAKSLIDYHIRSVFDQSLTWANATFTWASQDAEAQWVRDGDINSVSVDTYISPYTGVLPVDWLEGWSLNNTLTGEEGTVASESVGVTYRVARFQNGLYVDTGTQVSWTYAVASTFKMKFWLTFDTVPAGTVTYLRLIGAGTLSVQYNATSSQFELSDGTNTIAVPYSRAVGDRILIGVVQTATERRLHVAKLGEASASASGIHAPLGAFTTIRAY